MTLRTSKMSFETNLNLEIARKSKNETKKRKQTLNETTNAFTKNSEFQITKHCL